MSRRLLCLAAFALACHWSAVYAQQVTVPEESPPFTVIAAQLAHDLPDGAKPKYRWTASDGIHFGEGTADNKRPYFTGKPGPYTLTLTAVWIADGSPQLSIVSASGRIGPVGPQPPEPPPPPVKSLAELAGKDAELLARTYAALAKQVDQGAFSDVAEFGRVHEMLLADLGLDKNGAAAEIDKRLAVDSLEKLKAALEGIVAELGAPTPPIPDVKPIPAAGLHVLIVEETDDRGRIPPGQLASLQSTLIRGYVQDKGGQFRQYDDDPEIAEPLWRDARNRPRTALPWIIVSSDKGGVEQPLPASVDETLALIKRFE